MGFCFLTANMLQFFDWFDFVFDVDLLKKNLDVVLSLAIPSRSNLRETKMKFNKT
jgi:hypothetical protein